MQPWAVSSGVFNILTDLSITGSTKITSVVWLVSLSNTQATLQFEHHSFLQINLLFSFPLVRVPLLHAPFLFALLRSSPFLSVLHSAFLPRAHSSSQTKFMSSLLEVSLGTPSPLGCYIGKSV